MSKSDNLRRAKAAKQDEFYTQLTDIEHELKHYRELFKDKVVFCNCDDPEYSNFWQYFNLNFDFLGLRKLIATHYQTEKPSYMLEMYRDEKGTHTVIKTLKGNGDFRSDECIELLKEADIVVTNPPFSLFREYIALLMEYNKKFVIIGNQNAITYKEFFPLLKDNKVWIGYGANKTLEFMVPDYYEAKATNSNGRKVVKVPAITWFTNLDLKKRHEDLILYKHYTPGEYPHYDNYDAIDVCRVKEIPIDYTGVMGVPITFIACHNPDEFEILGITDRQNSSGLRTKKYTLQDSLDYNDLNAGPVLNIHGMLKSLYARILIRRKMQR